MFSTFHRNLPCSKVAYFYVHNIGGGSIPYDGTVISAGGNLANTPYISSYGQSVNLQIHGADGKPTNYGYRIAHNSQILVGAGDTVKAGQAVSLSGNSGKSTGPHTHVEIIKYNPKEDAWVTIIPSKQDLEEMKRLGIAK
ncbi:M23 family metallopeptidase [Leptospira sp. 'Mane']|uniref:M23 family metallopeptidase n=1 Tax=Leptospira sp. 'Mane' TaxID=3387407 RepID=UPI00398AC977